MSLQVPSKLLRFRNESGVNLFYPMNRLRGIFRNGQYAEFFFDPLQNSIGDGTTDGVSDKIKVKFLNTGVGDGMWTAIINMYNRIHTGKALVYTIADMKGAGGSGPFFGFGENGDIHVDTTVPADTVVYEIASTTP